MKLTQEHFKDLSRREADGCADDDDRRLLKQYRRQGFRVEGGGAQVSDSSRPAPAPAPPVHEPEPEPDPAPRRGRRS
jgi:hypothetical protein